jgi:triosephosphate isomerase
MQKTMEKCLEFLVLTIYDVNFTKRVFTAKEPLVLTESVRPTVIIGNWKMHKTIAESTAFVTSLGFVVRNCSTLVGLAVPFTMITAAADAARGTMVAIGAQNASDAEEGAFTGEISCRMLKDAGASFVIVGHSERRHLFHEDNAFINRKVKRALSDGLRPLLCIGETGEQHQQGTTHEVLEKQLREGLADVSPQQMESIVLAYEPVWAIGTNKTATPEIAQANHHFIRECVAKQWGKYVADRIVIQYGGSVKPENATALLDQPDIDGFLVGGASLSLDSFVKIIQCHHMKVGEQQNNR